MIVFSDAKSNTTFFYLKRHEVFDLRCEMGIEEAR